MEYIKLNGTEYECKKIITGIDYISLTMGGDTNEIKNVFKDADKLEVSGADKVTYGIYDNLSFESVTAYGDDTVMVTMHIKSDVEIRLDALERLQKIHDEAIVELAETVGGVV